MSETNRHRPPTAEQLLGRLYRKHLELHKVVAALKDQVEQLVTSTLITEVLAGHVERLLVEKQTLLQIVEADRYMAAALPRRNPPVLTEIAR